MLIKVLKNIKKQLCRSTSHHRENPNFAGPDVIPMLVGCFWQWHYYYMQNLSNIIGWKKLLMVLWRPSPIPFSRWLPPTHPPLSGPRHPLYRQINHTALCLLQCPHYLCVLIKRIQFSADYPVSVKSLFR